MWEVGGLEGSAEDCYGVVLRGHVVESLGSAVVASVSDVNVRGVEQTVLFLYPWL